MTITYSDQVHFLLCRWRGSVWKTVWVHLLIWLILWYIVYFVLNFALAHERHSGAVRVVELFDKYCNSLPLVFILGFYVGQVVTRWWNQVMCVPWPDDAVAAFNTCLGANDGTRDARESVARWLVLCQAMAFRQVSTRVHKRFPRLEHLIDAGLMTEEELRVIEACNCANSRWQLPLDWIVGRVIDPSEMVPPSKIACMHAVNSFRNGMRQLFMYNWVGIPLVYAQTVTIAVYGYFGFALIGHQYLDKPVDLYFPWFTTLQFVFFVGWLNVAREMMHPLGEDEDDLELNCILDRHAAVAFSMASSDHAEMPAILTDVAKRSAMGEKMLNNLSYSVAATRIIDHPPKMKAYVRVKMDDETQLDGTQKVKGREDHADKCKTPVNYF